MESGDSFLFDEQVISITSQSREHSYALIIDAINRAVRASFERVHDLYSEPELKADDKRVHEVTEEEKSSNSNSPSDEQNVQALKAALLAKFGSSNDKAWQTFSKDGAIGKKEWRKIIRKTMPTITQAETKILRKALPKSVNLVEFSDWLEGGKGQKKAEDESSSPTIDESNFADLPVEVCWSRSLASLLIVLYPLFRYQSCQARSSQDHTPMNSLLLHYWILLASTRHQLQLPRAE